MQITIIKCHHSNNVSQEAVFKILIIMYKFSSALITSLSRLYQNKRIQFIFNPNPSPSLSLLLAPWHIFTKPDVYPLESQLELAKFTVLNHSTNRNMHQNSRSIYSIIVLFSFEILYLSAGNVSGVLFRMVCFYPRHLLIFNKNVLYNLLTSQLKRASLEYALAQATTSQFYLAKIATSLTIDRKDS